MSKNDKELLEIYFDHGVDLTHRRIFLSEDIDDYSSNTILKSVCWMESINKDPIEIFVSSYGGGEYDMLSMYDTIKASKCQINTIATGKCMSAAPLIVAAGAKGYRYAYPNTWFMIHDSWLEVLFKKRAEIKSDMKHYDALHDQWLSAITQNSSMPKEFWSKICKEPTDKYFDAKKALEYGLIDQIWIG